METKTVNYLFLLGGHDLEMLEIKNLLIQNNQNFADHNLSWDNATWKDYADETEKRENKGKTFVGIELSYKECKPDKAIDIDHHNFDSEKKSSIEQVAELLKITLNRWQELIAANDRGYIPEMEKICATEDEIKEIREADKRAQGVTKKDETDATESVNNHKSEIDGLVVIESMADKFSPIVDLMYKQARKLIIYNNKSLSYYGPIPDSLVSNYKDQIDAHKVYYGGRKDNGFFGLAKGHWNKETIAEEKDKIIKIINTVPNENIFSYHIFLFPFRWKNWKTESDSDFKKNFELKAFRENLDSSAGCNWERKRFALTYPDQYNEYNYFYEYVREILYDLGDDLKVDKTKNNDLLINHFEYNNPDGRKLYYNIKIKENQKPYHLDVDSILLNIYNTGTGVLSFHLRNHSYYEPDDILKINKFGRRLFVPFFDIEPDSIYTGNKDKTNPKLLLCSTKKYEIPDAIWIGETNEPDKDDPFYEDFSKYLNHDNYKYGPFALPKFIEGMFPNNFLLTHENEGIVNGSKQIRDKRFKVYLRPVLDDRMFTICWYGNSQLSNDLMRIPKCDDLVNGKESINDNRHKKAYYSYETNDWWYSYIYVDTSPMHTNKFQKKELLKSQTYSRWIGNGTLYGISRYSLVMLTGNFSDLEKYNATFLVRHLQSLYYKMAELCLLQRATILNFSNEVTVVGDLINTDTKDKRVLEKIESLYQHYLFFVNKIYFREITTQEQGIEMYDIIQNSLRISQEVKNLDYEIDELNRMSDLMEKRSTSGFLNKITILGGIFVIPNLVAAFVKTGWLNGINTYWMPEYVRWFTHFFRHQGLKEFYLASIPFEQLIGSIVFIIVMVTYLFNNYLKKNSKGIISIQFFLFIFLATVLYVAFYPLFNIVVGLGIYLLMFTLMITVFWAIKKIINPKKNES